MDLLFKKEEFSKSFKDLLGFVDADIRFERVKPSLEIATDEIIDLIGADTYESFFQEVEISELHKMVKYAIALGGYMLYAPTADLSVTNNGRLMRRDDHQVAAFEWQIERNDEALQALYYRHLDRMLKYMVQHSFKINWEKYNHSGLIVSKLTDFETYFNINGSYLLYLKLLPAIREFEQNEIMPRLGSQQKGWELKDWNLVLSEPISYTSPIVQLLQNACVNYAMAWGIRRLNIQLFPNGVLQTSKVSNQGQNRKRGDKLEHIEVAMVFEKNFEKLLLKIEDEVARLDRAFKICNKKSDIGEDFDFGFDRNSGFIDT